MTETEEGRTFYSSEYAAVSGIANELTTCQQALNQVVGPHGTGINQLNVVPKNIQQGRRRGLFYINGKGKKVYLKQYQRKQYNHQVLPGALL